MRSDHFQTLGEQVLSAIWVAAVVMVLAAFEVTTSVTTLTRARCRRCGYCLEGLPEHPCCPECGEGEADLWEGRRRRLAYSKAKAGRMMLFLPALLLLPWIQVVGWYWVCRIGGFSQALAAKSSVPSGPIGDADTLPVLAWIVVPAALALACIPTRHLRRAALTFSLVLAGAALADLAWQWWGPKWMRPDPPNPLVVAVAWGGALAWAFVPRGRSRHGG